ncbi:MAG: SUMF1/EgtB/PvdO family nonheme iron enzyme [Chthoniobacterales bacterium]
MYSFFKCSCLCLLVLSANTLVAQSDSDATSALTGTNFIEVVKVGDTNNPASSAGLGSVATTYYIGKYDVTAEQYCAFLNAVGKSDPSDNQGSGLYDPRMGGIINDTNVSDNSGATNSNNVPAKSRGPHMSPPSKAEPNPTGDPNDGDPAVACIQRSGTLGNYTYSVIPGREKFPITYVTFLSALKFCNWMENGQPSTGVDGVETTMTGSYIIGGGNNGLQVLRNPNAKWVLPEKDQWYKAAYYNPERYAYWSYTTQNNNIPGNSLDATIPNNANYSINGIYATGKAPYLTPVGSFQASPGAYGTYDMSGDVCQWGILLTGNGFDAITVGDSWASERIGITDDNGFFSQNYFTGQNTIGFRLVYIPPPVAPSYLEQALESAEAQPTGVFYSAMNGWFASAMAGALKSALVTTISPETRQVIALQSENAGNRAALENVIARSNLQSTIIGGYANERANISLSEEVTENIAQAVEQLLANEIPALAPAADLAAVATAEETFAICSLPMLGMAAVPLLVGGAAAAAFYYFDPINGIGTGGALAAHAAYDVWALGKAIASSASWW